jgi:hypothetical protein
MLCSEWLEPHWHTAIYACPERATPSQSVSGRFMSTSYEHIGDGWTFNGKPIDAAAESVTGRALLLKSLQCFLLSRESG